MPTEANGKSMIQSVAAAAVEKTTECYSGAQPWPDEYTLRTQRALLSHTDDIYTGLTLSPEHDCSEVLCQGKVINEIPSPETGRLPPHVLWTFRHKVSKPWGLAFPLPVGDTDLR